MTEQAIEQEIQAKGLTAPRVTPADIEANIASTVYFTAAQGCVGNVDMNVSDKTLNCLDLLTFCVLVLKNGFTVTGESACASPENFNAEIGRKIARENAKQKIWPLMGYQLREQLFQATQPAQTPVASDMPPHQQRVITEKAELDEKRAKLNAFMAGEQFFVLCDEVERMRMIDQYNAMTKYSEALGERIDAFHR